MFWTRLGQILICLLLLGYASGCGTPHVRIGESRLFSEGKSSPGETSITGVASRPSAGLPSGNDAVPSAAGAHNPNVGIAEEETPNQPAAPNQAMQTPPQAGQAVTSVDLLIAELEAEGLLDDESKSQLTADLCRTPPQLWPALVQTFRAALELRKRRAGPAHNPSLVPGGQLARAQNPPDTPAGVSRGREAGSNEVSIEDVFSFSDGSAFDNREVGELSSSGLASKSESRKPGDLLAVSYEETRSNASKTVMPSGGCSISLSSAQAGGEPPSVAQPRGTGDARPGSGAGVAPQRETEVKADAQSVPATSWQTLAHQALDHLYEAESGDASQQVAARLIHVALADRDQALQPIPDLSPAIQEFWSETFFAILLLQDANLNPDPKLRLAEARRHLLNAARRLSEECPLEVTGLAFVSSVQSWGVYEAFEKYEFSPGQKVLLYAEIENLASESTAKGYRTAWRSSYQILDSSGKTIASYEYAANEEYCRRPRQDFFIGCELSLPKETPPGRYTLRLTVADLIKQRVGHGTIEFSLRTVEAK